MSSMPPRPGDEYLHHTLRDVSALVIDADESAVVFERRTIFGTYQEWHRLAVFRELYPRVKT